MSGDINIVFNTKAYTEGLKIAEYYNNNQNWYT